MKRFLKEIRKGAVKYFTVAIVSVMVLCFIISGANTFLMTSGIVSEAFAATANSITDADTNPKVFTINMASGSGAKTLADAATSSWVVLGLANNLTCAIRMPEYEDIALKDAASSTIIIQVSVDKKSWWEPLQRITNASGTLAMSSRPSSTLRASNPWYGDLHSVTSTQGIQPHRDYFKPMFRYVRAAQGYAKENTTGTTFVNCVSDYRN